MARAQLLGEAATDDTAAAADTAQPNAPASGTANAAAASIDTNIGNPCSFLHEGHITTGQCGLRKIEAAAHAAGGVLTSQRAECQKRGGKEVIDSEGVSSRSDEPGNKQLRSAKRWVINDHLEARETGPSCGNGIFARKPLPAGWTFYEHPVCVEGNSFASSGVRRLPASSDLDELMAEVSSRASTGSLLHERLVHGRWAMSFVPRHFEMQDTTEAELPDWSRELGLTVNQYNTLAAQLQSNVARVHGVRSLVQLADGDDSGLVLNPILRLCNHSCAPNAQLAWTAAPSAECPCGVGQFRLLALQDISADEEIRYTYIGTPGVDAPLSADARRAVLHRRWGFWCGCSMCASE